MNTKEQDLRLNSEELNQVSGGARFEDGRKFTSGDRVRLIGTLSSRYTDCIVETDGRLKEGEWTHGLSVLDNQTGERAIIEVFESEIEFQ